MIATLESFQDPAYRGYDYKCREFTLGFTFPRSLAARWGRGHLSVRLGRYRADIFTPFAGWSREEPIYLDLWRYDLEDGGQYWSTHTYSKEVWHGR